MIKVQTASSSNARGTLVRQSLNVVIVGCAHVPLRLSRLEFTLAEAPWKVLSPGRNSEVSDIANVVVLL